MCKAPNKSKITTFLRQIRSNIRISAPKINRREGGEGHYTMAESWKISKARLRQIGLNELTMSFFQMRLKCLICFLV